MNSSVGKQQPGRRGRKVGWESPQYACGGCVVHAAHDSLWLLVLRPACLLGRVVLQMHGTPAVVVQDATCTGNMYMCTCRVLFVGAVLCTFALLIT
jgi:hypothetical protein